MQLRTMLSCSALALLALTSVARADAIMMPPPCPEGSMNAFCHGPATCRASTCTTTSECAAGETCAPRALCTETHLCGGGLGGPSTMITHVDGSCAASGACAAGTCSTLSVCVPGSTTDASTTADASRTGDAGTTPEHLVSCGCRAGTRGGSAVAIASLIAALAIVAARRRSSHAR